MQWNVGHLSAAAAATSQSANIPQVYAIYKLLWHYIYVYIYIFFLVVKGKKPNETGKEISRAHQ